MQDENNTTINVVSDEIVGFIENEEVPTELSTEVLDIMPSIEVEEGS